MTEFDQQRMAPPAMPETSGKAIASLVVGIIAFFTCPPVGGLIAVIVGNRAVVDIRASRGRYTGEGLANAGTLLGWLNLAWTALWVVLVLFFVASTAHALD